MNAIEAIHLTIPHNSQNERLDKVLAQLLPEYSRQRIQQWITEGHLLCNGHIEKNIRSKLKGGELIELQPQLHAADHPNQAEALDLNIVYEDDELMIINKPAGLVVHPAAGNWSGTLLNGLLHHCPALHEVPRAGIVHRLDKDTSGLLVVAKTLVAQTDLVRQLQARTVKREYIAVVHGIPPQSGIIDKALERDPHNRLRMSIVNNTGRDQEIDRGKEARTHFYRLKTCQNADLRWSWVRCLLETGRTHQIRVHMQSIGHSLIGDAVYRGKQIHITQHEDQDTNVIEQILNWPRQALHARHLELQHPTTKKMMDWNCALADDLKRLLSFSGLKEKDLG